MPTPGSPTSAAAPSEHDASGSAGSSRSSGSEEVTELGSLVATGVGPAARIVEPGATLGRYRLGPRLGAGAMGAVYEAHDPALDRAVAIKVLHAELPEVARQRMKQEALILARLSHPNIVEVYETIHAPDQTFIVMQLVRGQTLARWRGRDPPPTWQEAVRVYREAGAGLAAAHAAGFVHRDFKPGNCILGDDGRVRVLDFGVAMALFGDALASVTVGDAPPGGDVAMTRHGTFVGTPAYMAPEQARGEACDARADQYAFCASLYEAVYGEQPIVADSTAALFVALDRGEIRPPPAGRRVPAALRRVLLRGLSRNPDQRWPSMDALLVALGRVVAPRRRWLAPLVLLGALAPATAAWLGWGGSTDPRCATEPPPLHDVWDDARREQVQAAVLATGLPYAPAAWARIEHDLDGYASAWALEHAELCAAIRTRTETATDAAALRMACLHERRLALAETVEVLAAATASRVEKAVPLLAELPALSRCDDVDALRVEQSQVPDPAVAARVEAVRVLLRRSERLGAAGEYDESLRVLDEARAEVEALGQASLQAVAARLEGTLHNDQGRFVEAASALERGYLLAVEHDLDEEATRSAQGLAFAMSQQARLDDALRWGRTARARARGYGVGSRQEAAALRAIGVVLHRRGELGDALDHQRQALALLEQDPSLPSLAVAVTLEDMSQTLRDDDQLPAALEHQRRAIALYEEAVGPAHPYSGTARLNLATVLKGLGELEQATSELRKAAAIFEGARGPSHPHVGATWANLGEVLRLQGRLDESRETFERALPIFEQAYGPSHPETAKVLASIGTVLSFQGRLDEALAHHQRALAILEETLGPRHPTAAQLHNNLGQLLHAQGKPDEALASFRRAAEIFEEALGPQHASVAGALNNTAALLADRGETEEAHALARRVLLLKEGALGPHHPNLVATLLLIAKLARARDELPAAREHVERALSIHAASEGPPAELAATRLLAARVLWTDPAQRPRARALAEAARETYAALGEGHREQLAAAEAWLADPQAE
jgi:eukaryotic-like serine/threonine-protein kinase